MPTEYKVVFCFVLFVFFAEGRRNLMPNFPDGKTRMQREAGYNFAEDGPLRL
jgi:hypothetical protein